MNLIHEVCHLGAPVIILEALFTKVTKKKKKKNFFAALLTKLTKKKGNFLVFGV